MAWVAATVTTIDPRNIDFLFPPKHIKVSKRLR
jgi:hypothetical protein